MKKFDGITLVGITGKAQQGKSTFADLLDDCLTEAMQMIVGRHGISATFKETWCRLHGDGINIHTLESLKPRRVKTYDITHRRALELLGDFGRAIDKHFWMDSLGSDIRRIQTSLSEMGVPYEIVIIPDVRTDDEAEWIRERGGIITHVRSNTLPTIDSNHTVQTQPVEMRGDDIEVWNNGTKQDLAHAAAQVAVALHRRHHG